MGAGPVLLLPTASYDALGGEKWGIGPTAAALKQDGPWTYGALVNHIESFEGEDDRADISATFIQRDIKGDKTTMGCDVQMFDSLINL